MSSFLFWNQKGEFFHNLAPWNLSLSTPHVSRGLAVADYDNDGAIDLAIMDRDAGVRLLHNRCPPATGSSCGCAAWSAAEPSPVGRR